MASSFRDLLANTWGELVRDERFRFRLVRIDGIEISQAIQYYRADQHLSDPNDRGGDNSVPLVMYKPAWVRVYVRSPFAPAGRLVSGRLIVQRSRRGLPAPTSTLTLDPVAPGNTLARENPDYQTERSAIGSTLNFLIPAEEVAGQLRLAAEIWLDGGDPGQPEHRYETSVGVHLQQTLSLRGVLISYRGLNAAGTATVTLAAPTVADLAATAAWSLTVMPVEAQPLVSSAGGFEWTRRLTGTATEPGGCSQQWLDLNVEVAEVKANDGNRPDVIYYGLVPAAIPILNVGGCATSGVASGAENDQITMAHEVGHACGLGHGPCNTPGDTNYPAYEPYDPANNPTASLGEYGLDTNTGQVRLPGEKDLMSYCNGDWLSLYHYRSLLGSQILTPPWARVWRPRLLVDPYVAPWEELIPPIPEWDLHRERMRPQSVVSLIGTVNADEVLEVRSLTRVTASATLRDASPTVYRVQLLGKRNEVVSEAPLMRLRSQGTCRCGGCGSEQSTADGAPYVVQAMMPDPGSGTTIRIVRRDPGGKDSVTVWSRTAPEKPPSIGDVRVSLTKSRGTIRWSSAAKGTDLRHAIQFSKDGGRSWNGLTVGLSGTEYSFETLALPSGKILFRVFAHDGFYSASAVSKEVVVPERPALPVILHPRKGAVYRAGELLRLAATTVARDPGEFEAQRFSWRIDDKAAGCGSELWIEGPPAGEHRCELTADGPYGTASATTTLTTVSDPPEPR